MRAISLDEAVTIINACFAAAKELSLKEGIFAGISCGAAIRTAQRIAHASAIRWRDPSAFHLAGLGINPLAGDLRSMLIKSHYDAQGRPQAPRFERLRGHAPRLS